MRRLLRTIALAMLPLMALVLVFGVPGTHLVPVYRHNSISLMPDSCSKTSPLAKASPVLMVPAFVAFVIYLPLVLTIALSEGPICLSPLPEEHFRPPCL